MNTIAAPIPRPVAESNAQRQPDHARRAQRTLPRVSWVYAGIPLVLVVAGGAAAHEFIAFAFASNMALNGLILGVFLLGVAMILARLFHVAKESRVFDWKLAQLTGLERRALPAKLETTEVAETFRRLEAHGLAPGQYMPPAAIEAEVEALEHALERRYEFAQFLVGGMVALGLLGTFIGLLETLIKTSELIGSIGGGSGGGNMEDEFRGIVNNLKAPLEAMGTAFSASMFGLVGSIMLGLELVAVRSAATKLIEGVRTGLLRVAGGEVGEEGVEGGDVSEEYLAGFIAYLKRHHERSHELLCSANEISTQMVPVVDALRGQIEHVDTRLDAFERGSRQADLRLEMVSAEMRTMADRISAQTAEMSRIAQALEDQRETAVGVEQFGRQVEALLEVMRGEQSVSGDIRQAVWRVHSVIQEQGEVQASIAAEQLVSLRSIVAMQSRSIKASADIDLGMARVAAGVGVIADRLKGGAEGKSA